MPRRSTITSISLIAALVGAAAVTAGIVIGREADDSAAGMAMLQDMPGDYTPPEFGDLTVTGYAVAGETTEAQLASSATSVTVLSVDGLTVGRDGSSVSELRPEAADLLDDAHHVGQRAELIVANHPDGSVDSSAIAANLLGSTANMAAVVTEVADEVTNGGWDGVSVDLEGLTANDAHGLTSFISQLRAALDPESTISLCLAATDGDYTVVGYDLPALGAVVDNVVLLGYAEHESAGSKPGPVGGTPWVREVVAPVLAAVPASKVQLGVAGYGYLWPADGAPPVQMSDKQARAAAADDGSAANWDFEQHEWNAVLADGTNLWWSDTRTLAARVELANELGLGGVAVWSLSLSDPLG